MSRRLPVAGALSRRASREAERLVEAAQLAREASSPIAAAQRRRAPAWACFAAALLMPVILLAFYPGDGGARRARRGAAL